MRSKKAQDNERLRTENADTKAGRKNRGIGEKGSPIARVGSVPGYNKSTGTPGWIREAADHAEKLAGKNDLRRMGTGKDGAPDGAHKHYGLGESSCGRPSYGKKAEVKEKIHGGQAKRLGK